MQLDRPKRRQRPREQGRREQSDDTTTPQDPFAAATAPAPPPYQSQPQQSDPFAQPKSTLANPFSRTQPNFQADPYPPTRKPFTPQKEKPLFGRSEDAFQDPFPAQNAFTPPKEKPFFGQQTFQQPWGAAQKPFTPPKVEPFNAAGSSFPKSDFAKPATNPPFAPFGADKPKRFPKPASRGSDAGATFASGITFGPAEPQGDPFAQQPSRKPVFRQPVERREKRESYYPIESHAENDAFGVIPDTALHEPKGKRRSTPRRTRTSRERDVQPTQSDADADIDLGDDVAVEPFKRRAQSRNQLLLTSVPIPLFSRAAIQRHFSSVQNLTVSHVSLRGSRRPDARRSALISFPDERQAALALREGNMFRGTPLRLAVYRQAAPEQVGESNELFFNYVPEALFSEEGVTDLFDSISDNGVVRVSLKEKPFYGSVKRTAILTFKSVAAAAKALQNLPLYKGRPLTVSFRRTPPGASNAVAAAPDDGEDPGPPPSKSYGSEDRQGYNNGAQEMPSILKRMGRSPYQPKRASRVESQEEEVAEPYDYLDQETEEDYEQPSTSDVGDRLGEEEESARSKAAKMKAEMHRLRAAIEKKQKQRSLMTQSERGKRESKLMIPKRREAPSTEHDASNGWRKVGEKVDIKNAMNFVGTCMTMCPLKEFEDRIIQRDISMFEKDDEGEPSFNKSVKKYRRSAAISEQPSPDEVRPPQVLLTTMNHLMKICDSVDAKFADVHNFVRDRTRSVRQDFTLQGARDESCIKIHEQSVRFHILSEHRLFGTDPAIFSSKQNREQLDKCLISLREMYDLRRDDDLNTSPDEPEMQAYYMLTQMSDPKTCVQLCTGFSQDVRSSPPVQFALAVVRAASDGFGSFTRYFSLVRSAPYLMACLMHSRFSEVRVRALAVINSTHGNPSSRRDTIPISVLTRQLAFESEDETVRFCRTLGLTVENAKVPSNGPEQLAIRTPSGGFDETKKKAWKASRADVLIESKAQRLKTSDIVLGDGRNDYRPDKFMKKSSALLRAREKKPVVMHSAKPKSLFPEPLQTAPSAPMNVPVLSTSHFAVEQTQPSATRPPEEPKKRSHPTEPEINSTEDRKRSRGVFTKPELPSAPSVFPAFQKRKRDLTSPPKNLPKFPFAIPAGSTPVYPSKTFRPEGEAMSSDLQSVQRIDKPPRSMGFFDIAKSERKADSDMEKPKVALTEETVDEKDHATRMKSRSETTVMDGKPSAEKLKIASRLSALKSLLVGLTDSSEADIRKVREIIEDVEAGKLKFPKAMEVWDDARDILLSVSEKSERGVQALKREGYLEEKKLPEDATIIANLRRKVLYLSQEGKELRDQLDEMFSKSLAVATTNLKENGPRHSIPLLTPQLVPANTHTEITGAYLLDDEESPFDSRELPESGCESQNAVKTILTTHLHKWQTIIVSLTGESEAGIAQRWLRHRFATNPDNETGLLSIINAKETCPVSLSVREIKRISAIPYTADFIVLPCDISKIRNDPSSTWAVLEQVLQKNRSVALSHNLPPPMVVILYYCGSSDMPFWLTNDDSFGSFASFQTKIQEKGYVANVENIELPRIPAFQGIQCESFTDLMISGIRKAARDYEKLRGIPLKKNLRDHLVHVANSVLGRVLGSRYPFEGNKSFRQCIHDINQSWRKVARHLRGEEARWPKEMAVRRRLKDAFTAIESNLRLPVFETSSSSNEYIRQMGAYVGLAIPTSQPLEGVHWFSIGLSHLMNAFVCKKLKDCPVYSVYLSSETEIFVKQQNANRTLMYTHDPIRLEKREEGLQSRYLSRTLLKQGTKRRRDTDVINGRERPSDAMKRRLSFSAAEPIQEDLEPTDVVPNRRQSLPASYGRRRMHEMLDEICREGQTFDELLQTTMDALISKRRRLESYQAVLAS